MQVIFLLSLCALAMLPANVGVCLSWFAGTVASTINFLVMAYATFTLPLPDSPSDTKGSIRRTSLVFFLRYAFLIVWSLVAILVFHFDLVSYCVGLFTSQIAVFLYQVYYVIRNGKAQEYFRGNDE